MVSETQRDIKRVQGKLEALKQTASANAKIGLRQEADDLEQDIDDSINTHGLVETGELRESVLNYPYSQSTSRIIKIDKEYASALEKGRVMDITPTDAQVLAWEPENPSEWQDSPNYNAEENMVFMPRVDNHEIEPRNYVEYALGFWQNDGGGKIDNRMADAIRQAGFKRKT